ncbi:sensor histidine kinase [Sphingosinithalassobacter sp. CS137]|uniref:sensor histidine kinase n=1 Tax=Sphingosinithalassobacter sp. CS137 TaxID=2762748 RepID=UPI00165D6607|nr:histidine kinase dimerization/phosphoacceptor domain -containing protein [Sphingosinithalassobacter sp. CS137]
MARIGELDLPDRLAPAVPRLITQIGFALLCSGATTMVRALVDVVATSAGPFALGYPAVLIATLFGRSTAGVLTAIIVLFYSWFFILPEFGSFAFAEPADWARLLVNACAYGLVVAVAELFRRAVRRASAERDREVAERDLFLQEFDHRVKNNFALVASLLDLQRRRAAEAATVEALGDALSRVESIARAHRHLYRGGSTVGEVDIAAYLRELCAALSDSLFLRTSITLLCDSDHAQIARDRAVSIGLVVNELVTNAVKHAFAGREAGEIRVEFRRHDGGYLLTVRDNGIGMNEDTPVADRQSGLGQRLIDAFARQAGGTLSRDTGPSGTTFRLELEP